VISEHRIDFKRNVYHWAKPKKKLLIWTKKAPRYTGLSLELETGEKDAAHLVQRRQKNAKRAEKNSTYAEFSSQS
jgi:hypothetical protein